MNKLIIFAVGVMLVSSCSATKKDTASRSDNRREEKVLQQADIKNAVQAKRFIIKFDRLYSTRGGMIDIVPKANYLVVDGERAILSAAYIGRQFGIRPIAAINMTGRTEDYMLTDNSAKERYQIKMKVKNDRNSFDVYVTISKNGFCDVSVSNIKTDLVRYSGSIVPLKNKQNRQTAPPAPEAPATHDDPMI